MKATAKTREQTPHIFCFGLGYVGQALTAALQKKGWKISGTTREPEQAAILERLHYRVYPFDGTFPFAMEAFEGVTHILMTIPPNRIGDPVLNQLKGHIQKLPDLRWVGYLSTTGVYGDHGGNWVDEETPCIPSMERSVNRLRAENLWLEAFETQNTSVQIFRLAGIYGPSRNSIAALHAGRARRIIKPGQMFGRIHVDDIVAVLSSAAKMAGPTRLYNVCDDEHAPPQDVAEFAADLVGLPVPPGIDFDHAGLSDMAKSFYRDNKKVRNDRMKEELGIKLLYPDYKAGLRAIFSEYGSKGAP